MSRPDPAAASESGAHQVEPLPRWVWPWALAAFVLAAGTGAGMRFGLAYGWPAGLDITNARHAHSHLMYFGWVTPALFALIAAALARTGVTVGGLRPLLGATFLAAFASYPAFLASGYRSATWLGADLPWSMMAAALNGAAWLAFLGLYTWSSLRPAARRDEGARTVAGWFDAATFLLAASLVGIVGLAGTAMGGLAEPRTTAAWVDLFLAWFGEGWFTAGVFGTAVGAMWSGAGRRRGAASLRLAALVFAIGMVLRELSTFLLALGPTAGRVLSEAARAAEAGASVGHLLVGLALAGAAMTLLSWRPWRGAETALWTPALAFLLLKGVMEVALASPTFRDLVVQANLRVLLLHAFLLGGISLAVVAAAAHRDRASRWLAWSFAAGVLVLLAGLVPLSSLFPIGMQGLWVLHLAAWTSLGPVIAALALLGRAIAGTRRVGSP